MTVNAAVTSLLPPYILWCSGDVSATTNWCWAVRDSVRNGMAVRFVRGRKMATWSELLDEFAAALQFPYYFGSNLNAFDECITDLSWISAEGFLIVVWNADELLASCGDEEFALFASHLVHAGEEWAKEVRDGESWDRPGRPFHVLFHVDTAQESRLLQRFCELHPVRLFPES